MTRHFILHIGPTNSGKTHQALQRLKQAYHGIYLGPLRLLALEVYDRMTAAGIPCSSVPQLHILTHIETLRYKFQSGIALMIDSLISIAAPFDHLYKDLFCRAGAAAIDKGENRIPGSASGH